MSNQEFRNEYLYGVTMGHIRSMLEKGLISAEEYQMAEEKMRNKYRPTSDGLLSETTCFVFREER